MSGLGHTSHSIHSVGSEHTQTEWDNANEPVLEVESGAVVELQTVDASGGQLDKSSTAQDVQTMDMNRVNPVTGPVFVKGAEPATRSPSRSSSSTRRHGAGPR